MNRQLLALSLSLSFGVIAYGSENAWPLEVKSFSQCVYKVPGNFSSELECVRGPQVKESLPKSYEALATSLEKLSSASSPEEISALLGSQPRRPGRLHTFRVGSKEMSTQQVEWQLSMDLATKEERGNQRDRAIFASYIDGILIQVQIIVAPVWIYTIKVSETKCVANCTQPAVLKK